MKRSANGTMEKTGKTSKAGKYGAAGLGARLRKAALVLGVAALPWVPARAEALTIGATAPDFTLSDQNGNEVRLDDFSGSGVILDFCAIWCAACKEFYNSVYPTLGGQSLLLPVLMQDNVGNPASAAHALAWASAYGFSSVAHPGGDLALHDGLLQDFLLEPGSQGYAFPTFVFIDADLEVIGRIVGAPAIGSAEWNTLVASIEASQQSKVPLSGTAWLLAAGMLLLAPGALRRRS